MSTRLTPRGKRRIDTDEKIVQAAIHQFGSKGFTAASLTDIAAEAGVSQGLVSQRFESKEKLLEDAFKVTPAASFFLDESAGPGAPAAGDSASDLSAALLFLVAALKKEQRSNKRRFAFTAMLYTAHDVPDSFIALSDALFRETPLPSLIKQGQTAGTLPKGDAYRLFTTFYKNALSLIRDCTETGLLLPDDTYFLTVLGLNSSGGPDTTSTASKDSTPTAGTDASQNATAAFVDRVRPALRAVEGYIGLIKKHAGEERRVRDYASKAELIASEFVRNLDKLK